MAFSGSARRTPRRATTSVAAAATTLLLTGLLAGCGADEPADPAPAGAAAGSAPASPSVDGPRLVQGGEPGEGASEVPSDTTLPANEWTRDDEVFFSQMIPHHAQALEMTELVPDRTENRAVRLLAERISGAQGPEITMMAAWLAERDLEVPTKADGHEDHGSGHEMAGMLTQAELDELAAARGTEFDRLFLERMIAHHAGALTMADETAGGGLDVRVGEARDDISSSQSAEIARMRNLLAQL